MRDKLFKWLFKREYEELKQARKDVVYWRDDALIHEIEGVRKINKLHHELSYLMYTGHTSADGISGLEDWK